MNLSQTQSDVYMVIGHFIVFGEETPFEKPRPSVLWTGEAANHQVAFLEFLAAYGIEQDVERAQVFYNDLVIVKVSREGIPLKMSEYFGELAKFPNHDLYKDGFDWRWE